MKILFTSVGRRVELIQAFYSAARLEKIALSIHGADISEAAPALMFCDKRHIVPPISNTDYIYSLLEIAEKEKIDILIPTIDTDLLVLAQNKSKFTEIGTKVLVSSYEKIKICRDKMSTQQFFAYIGLYTPKTVDDIKSYQGGFPAFIKPKDGSSSNNAYKISSGCELKEFSKKVDNYIVQPFIEGTEYTIDIFCDLDGDPIFITPRIRLAVRAGEVVKTQICQDERIIQEIRSLLKIYKPCGPLTVQLIREHSTLTDWYIEINPRFGGGCPLSMKAGADAARALIMLLNGKALSFIPNAAINGATYSRFDQSVRVK